MTPFESLDRIRRDCDCSRSVRMLILWHLNHLTGLDGIATMYCQQIIQSFPFESLDRIRRDCDIITEKIPGVSFNLNHLTGLDGIATITR